MPSATLDRRSFITGSALAAGAVAAAGTVAPALAAESAKGDAASSAQPSFMTAPEPIADSQIADTVEAEVIVVGAGTAGLVSALSCMDNGLDVVLFAQSEDIVARGGSNGVIYSKLMNEYGLERPSARYILAQMAQASFNIDVTKWHKWYNNSEESVNWLIDRTLTVEGMRVTIEQGNVWEDETYPLFGAEQSHCWNNDDFAVVADGQPSLCFAIRKLLEDGGVRLDFGVSAQQLVRGGKPNGTEGRVEAVIAKNADGSYVKYVGSKAIVLATGDFSGDREMMEKYCPEAVEWVTNWDMATNPDTLGKVYGGLYTGQGQKMGLWCGAAWQHTVPNAAMAANFGAPCPNPWNAPATLMVNDKGERFCAEDMGCGHLPYVIKHTGPVNAIFGSEYPSHNMPWHNWKNVYREGDMNAEQVLASWEDKVAAGGMMKFDTIEAMAAELGIDAAALQATVDRYNELCDAGEDYDFHKRAELLTPIREAPFYVWRKTAPTFLTVMGGLRTNIDMQVCDADDQSIEGLYNVGTMVGDAFANSYNFLIEGHNLGMNCITFGYLTGKLLAGGHHGVEADPDYDSMTIGQADLKDLRDAEAKRQEELASKPLKDGDYTATGYGIHGAIDVTINVKDGKISVTDISPNNETPGFGGYEAIEDGTFAKQVEEAQGADIDGISGATVTSTGIKNAVRKALEEARA